MNYSYALISSKRGLLDSPHIMVVFFLKKMLISRKGECIHNNRIMKVVR